MTTAPGCAVGAEQGSGTVLTVALTLLASSLLLGGVGLSQAHLAAQHTQSAADAGALAAAHGLLTQGNAHCARSAHLVTRNGARLVACRQHGPDRVRVTVTNQVQILGQSFTVTRQATAGVSS